MTPSEEARAIYNYQEKKKKDIKTYKNNFCKDCLLKEDKCEAKRFLPDRHLKGLYCRKKKTIHGEKK